MNKPIAIIAYNLMEGLVFAREFLEIKELSKMNRRITNHLGQIFYIITEPNQLLGLELSNFIVGRFAYDNPEINKIIETARQRIR